MPFSNAEANKIIDTYITKAASYGAPAAFYVALSTTTPDNAGGNVTEPSGGAYARLQILAADFNAAGTTVAQQAETNIDKSFPTATANWGGGQNMVAFAIYDAATAGTFLGWTAITTPRTVLNNDTAKIKAGELKIKTT